MSADPKNKTIDLSFEFQPDKQFFVRFIQFLGNTKTRDKVIRRELVLEEGKIFSSQALEHSVLRVNQLGFFEKIEEKDYEVKPDDKTGLVDVDVTVKEKSQRSIGFTGGVSGISGSFIGINYSDNNFMGRGEAVEVSITGGTRTTDFIFSFTEPYLLDSRWGLGLSVYNRRYRYDTYSKLRPAQHNRRCGGVVHPKDYRHNDLVKPAPAPFSVDIRRQLYLSEYRSGQYCDGL